MKDQWQIPQAIGILGLIFGVFVGAFFPQVKQTKTMPNYQPDGNKNLSFPQYLSLPL